MTPDSLSSAATNRPDAPTVTLSPKARAAAHQVYRTTRSLDAALGAYCAIGDALPTVTPADETGPYGYCEWGMPLSRPTCRVCDNND